MKTTMYAKQTLAVFLTVAVMLSMLPLSMISASAATKYLEGALSITIPDLSVGETPWTDIKNPTNISEGIYVSDIYWIDKGTDGKSYKKINGDTLLEAGHVYACHITVKTLDGYLIKDTEYRDDYNNRRWTNSTSIYVNGHKQQSENNGEDIYPVKDAYGDEATVVFPMLKSKVTEVSAELDEPIPNAHPDFTPDIESSKLLSMELYSPSDIAGYVDGVMWWDDTAKSMLNSDSVFTEGHSYQAAICLKAFETCSFTGTGSGTLPKGEINGKTAIVQSYSGKDTGDIIIVYYDFGECKKPQIWTVKITAVATPLPECLPDIAIGTEGSPGFERESVDHFENGIGWYDITAGKYLALDGNDVFQKGHQYKCNILLKAKDGYEFAASDDGSVSYVAATMNDKTAKVSYYPYKPIKERIMVSLEFGYCNYEVINEVGINDIEIIPRAGCKPDYDATVAGSVYTYNSKYRISTDSVSLTTKNGISWGDHTLSGARLDPENDTFIDKHYYRVFVDIVPQPGHIFATDSEGKAAFTGKIDGKNAVVGLYNGSEGSSQKAWVGLYTDQCGVEMITKASVSGVFEPVVGYSPSFEAISDDPYKYDIYTDFSDGSSITYAHDGVSWYDATDFKYLGKSDVFKSGHDYRCSVYLKPNAGFTFPGAKDDGTIGIHGYINGTKADAVRNNISKLMNTGGVLVSYTFNAGHTPVLHTFTVDDIVYPRPGKKPSYTAKTGKFTKLCTDYHSTDMLGYYNGIMWYDDTEKRRLAPEDTFIEGHKYYCSVVLEATGGCQFNFSEEDFPKIEGRIGDAVSYGSQISSQEEERRLYLDASALVGVCEKYYGPVTVLSRIDIADVTMPKAGEEANFSAKSLTEGVYIDKTFDDEKFHNGVCWIDMTEYHPLEVGEQFVEDHYYQLNIIVSAYDGYEFSQSGGSSNVYTYINDVHESSMHFGDNDTKKTRQAYASYKCLPQEPVYKITVKGGSASLGGNTVFWSEYGEVLTLQCSNTIASNFDHWECSDELVDITDISSAVTTFTMPDNDITFTAVTNVYDPDIYSINVIGGIALDKDNNIITESGSLRTVTLLWNAPETQIFDHWEADSNAIEIEDIHSSSTTFIMPKHDVTITAVTKGTTEQTYSITVENGKASMGGVTVTEAKPLDTVTITCSKMLLTKFDHWECSDSMVDITDINSAETTLLMPNNDIVVKAVLNEDMPSPGEDKVIDFADCQITVPEKNANPDFAPISLDSAKFSVEVYSWYLVEAPAYPELTASDNFEADKTYALRIKFTPNEGYKFDENTEFLINGNTTLGANTSLDQPIRETSYYVKDDGGIVGIYGDVDKDTSITANDALMILRASAGIDSFDSELTKIGDIDLDGVITAADALAVLRFSIGIDDGNLVGKPIIS